MTMSQLDPGQIIKLVYDSATEAIKVADANATNDILASYEIDFSDIDGSGGSLYEVTAATSDDVKQILLYDTTGISISLYTGGSGSETLKTLVGPGNDMVLPIQIPSGTRLSIRATGSSAPSAGKFYILLIG